MFIDRKEGEVSRLSFDFFFVSQCLKMPQGFLLVFQKIRLWRKFGREGEVGEYQDFPLKVSCLTVPECFVGQAFRVSLVAGVEKFCASEGYVTSFCQNFVSQYRNLSQGNPSVLCFRKLSVAKKFMDKRRWEYQDFPPNFFSHSAEKTSRVTLLCCVSESFRQQKCLQIGKRGKYQDFPSIFSSHSAEKCRRGVLQSFNNFSYGESLEEKVRGEKYQDFPLKVSCLAVPESFVGQPFRVSLVLGVETFYAPEACVTIFCLEIFVSEYRNVSQGNSSVLCFRKLPAAMKLMHRRSEDGVGSIKTFCQKIFVSQCRKKQQGKPSMLCFRKFSVAKKFMDKRRWEYQDFPSNLFSHSAEKTSRVTLLCCVSESFRQQKCLQIGKRGKYQDFPSIFFRLTVSKNALGFPFSLSKNSAMEKVWKRR